MKTMLAFTAAFALTAATGFAQSTSQAGVLGESGDPTYSLQVQGANGVIYNCIPNLETIDGVSARRCVAPGASGATNLGGLSGGAAVGAGALVLVALAASSGGSSSTTTTSP